MGQIAQQAQGQQMVEMTPKKNLQMLMKKSWPRIASVVGNNISGTGNGISMVLNKHQGIRAALCWSEEIAVLARRHNNANVISLPARFISEELALAIGTPATALFKASHVILGVPA